ncbi:hypothetical protein B0A54_00202 [Friedmanniomyces endolithicus]|uniref:Ubiquitin 3 binding protein But2 C-terminal domain-containing protein n=1 Tax=Friedmanniomyces endolithicus TaxID=329885 RepID=A0A4U0VM12_9PEZI|nr:hypothetical protein B0A54_00202 [Friedmanniomyces endolithicus]
MRPSTPLLTLLSLLTALASTSPTPGRPNHTPTNFLLVTTTQWPPTLNSSLLANVSATSLFDPYNQATYLLRLIAPGYGSLPRFNLSSGDLGSAAPGIEGVGVYEYNSTGTVVAGEELGFGAQVEPRGNLALKGGYLLTVGGEEAGWTVCGGAFGESVIYWKGTDASCTPTYIHAVANAPY